MPVWIHMALLYRFENLQKTVFWVRNSQMEDFVSFKFVMQYLVSFLHHRLVESQMSVWRQMVPLYLVENLQKTVFWARNS